jgi:hypothetical protein
MSCEGRIFDICSMAYSSLDRSAAIRLWRHINLAHALAYVGLSPAYTVKNFLEPLNEEFALCSEKEYAKLLKLDPDGGGGATREVITWATNDIVSQTKNIERPQRALKSLSTVALQARAEAARGVELKETIIDLILAQEMPGKKNVFHCRGPSGRLSAISVFLCKSVFYGAFVWARRALNGPKRRFPARAVAEQLSGLEIGELRARARLAGIALDSEISGAIKCSAGIPLDSRIPSGSSR